LGRSAINVALVQIAFDVITLFAVFAIGKRIGGDAVGLLSAAFTGFYLYLMFQSMTANDTSIFVMLLALGIWAVYRVYETRSWGYALLAGLLFGLIALTKSLVVFMLPLIAFWWILRLGWTRALQLSAVMLLVFALVIAPWVVRNSRLHNQLTFLSTNDGSNLYQGNNRCAADYLLAGWDVQWTAIPECIDFPPEGLTEVQESVWFRDRAVTFLVNNVGEWPRLIVAKLYALWWPEIMPRAVPINALMMDNEVQQYNQPAFQIARIVHLIYFTPLLLLGFAGLWVGWRDKKPIAPIVIVLIAITAAYLIYHPSTRYRAPADPFLFVLAAYALIRLWKRFRSE
jgi:4-amino-4-deoxy-L-arabinose transferase-like glycosyltransferase